MNTTIISSTFVDTYNRIDCSLDSALFFLIMKNFTINIQHTVLSSTDVENFNMVLRQEYNSYFNETYRTS
jgi:hypothetical protein